MPKKTNTDGPGDHQVHGDGWSGDTVRAARLAGTSSRPPAYHAGGVGHAPARDGAWRRSSASERPRNIGWWMVKSGLVGDADKLHNARRVSPHRLGHASHRRCSPHTSLARWTDARRDGIRRRPSFDAPPSSRCRRRAPASASTETRRRRPPPATRCWARRRRASGRRAPVLSSRSWASPRPAGVRRRHDVGRAYNTFPPRWTARTPGLGIGPRESRGWRNFFENTAGRAAVRSQSASSSPRWRRVTFVWGAHRFNAFVICPPPRRRSWTRRRW